MADAPIDIRDLQVGSLVQGHDTEVLTIIHTYGDGIAGRWGVWTTPGGQVCYSDRYCHLSQIKPIPITEEWLEKLGFVKTVTGKRLVFRHGPPERCIVVYAHYELDHWAYHLIFSRYALPVAALHQLQALTWTIDRVWLSIPQETPPDSN